MRLTLTGTRHVSRVVAGASVVLGIVAIGSEGHAQRFATLIDTPTNRSVQASIAPTVFDVDLTNVPMRRAIDEIAAKGGVKVAYAQRVVSEAPRVTLQAKGITASAALERIVRTTRLRVVVEEGHLAIVEGAASHVVSGGLAGLITDAKTKQPLRGATITISGLSRTATSDDAGKYRLSNVTAGTYVLVIRALGYTLTRRTVTISEDAVLDVDVTLSASVSALDQVVVTGTIVATAQKAVPSAMTIITAKELEQRGITHIDQLFRGDIPGLFAQSLGSGGTQPGKVVMSSRGSTTLDDAMKQPIKTYLDGVELADPAMLGLIDPQSIERIEILTGPQASTVYGSNAINGVMQVFTKRGTSARPQLTATLTNGLIQTNYSPALTPQHNANAQVSGLDGAWSYNVGGTWQYVGAWTPGQQLSTLSGFGGLRVQRGPVTADISLRNILAQNNLSGSTQQFRTAGRATGYLTPIVANGVSAPTTYSSVGQTFGLTLTYHPTSWWTHTGTVGRDNSNTGTQKNAAGYTYTTDTLLSITQTQSKRLSLGYTTSLHVSVTSATVADVTLGADGWQSLYTSLTGTPAALSGTLTGVSNPQRQPSHNRGAFLQGQVGVVDALFFTYGVRAEWNPNYGADVTPNIAPRYGLAYTRDFETPLGALTAKLRGSYGRSTRPPTVDEKIAVPGTYAPYVQVYGPYNSTLANPELVPEIQKGGEGGLELYFGNRGSLVITRYNQTVSDLIYSAVTDSVRSLLPNPTVYYHSLDSAGYGYYLQSQNLNLGAVRNQGWELQGSLSAGPFTTKGTYSWTKSRIIGVTAKYRSQFTWAYPGASFYYTPEHTWAGSIGYARAATVMSVNFQRIGPLVNSDFLYDLVVNNPPRLNGDWPRMSYPSGAIITAGYTTADLNASHRFSPLVEGILQVQNLADSYHNDQHVSLYANMGRQTSAGLRIRW